jgi:hypothetical protein
MSRIRSTMILDTGYVKVRREWLNVSKSILTVLAHRGDFDPLWLAQARNGKSFQQGYLCYLFKHSPKIYPTDRAAGPKCNSQHPPETMQCQISRPSNPIHECTDVPSMPSPRPRMPVLPLF